MEDRLTLRFALLDCGGKIAVAIKVGPWWRAFQFPNPFRRNLTNEQWARGDNRWRWPVSLWARP